MSLPKIAQPVFQIEIPSTKIKQNFRPYLVKEEKLLLMAKSGESESEMLLAIKKIIEATCLDNNFNVDDLTIFDLEFVFLRLRSHSVNSIVEVTYIDKDDQKPYKFSIRLDDINVKFPDESISPKIDAGNSVGIIMKYPTAALYSDKEFLSSGSEAYFQLIIRCIGQIYDAEKIYEIKNYNNTELTEFVENLSIEAFNKIKDFMNNQPSLYHEIKYTNETGMEKVIPLTTLSDFFILH